MWALNSLPGAQRHAEQYRTNDVCDREPELLMLIGIEVHTVHSTGRRHGPGVEELAVAFLRNGGERRRQPSGLLRGALELRRDSAFGFLDRWRRDDQNLRHGHAWLDRCLSNRLH